MSFITAVVIVVCCCDITSSLTGHLTGKEEVIQVEGIVGESVALPCRIDPPVGDRVAVILWYREHHPDALYTYDARSPGRHQHVNRAPGLKATFHPDPPARLVLPRATTKLAGEYECRVDYLHATSATTKVKLSIVELPESIYIKTPNGRNLQKEFTANLDDQLSLLCQVVGGRPQPRVWWTLNGEVLPATQPPERDLYIRPLLSGDLTGNELTPRRNELTAPLGELISPPNRMEEEDSPPQSEIPLGSTEVSVTIPALKREHQGAPLTCHAANTNTSSASLRATISITLNTPPSRVIISGLPDNMAVEGRYRAWCSAPDSRPPPVLIWSRTRLGKKPTVLSRQELGERNVSRSWLDLVMEWQDDKATLTCTAINHLIPDKEVTNTTTLSVRFAPRVRLSLGTMLRADNIKEDTDVYFRCDVQSNPPPNRIAWFHNDQEVHADSHVIVSMEHLVLQKVHRKWSGNFACSASNGIGQGAMSKPLYIAIQYAPVCGRSRPMVYRAAVDQEVTLPCRVLANPTNLTFDWTFTNSALQANSSPSGAALKGTPTGGGTATPQSVGITGGVRTSAGMEGRLKYIIKRPQDYGTVECRAENSVGRQSVPCVFTVRPPGVPSSDFSCKVTKQTWESVEISCETSKAVSANPAESPTEKRENQKSPIETVNNPNIIRGMTISKSSGYNKWLPSSKATETSSQANSEQSIAEEVRADELQQKALEEDILGVEEVDEFSDETKFLLTVKERNSQSLIHNTTGTLGSFNLTGLTPGADYVIRVWRVNRRGRSAPVKLETFTLRTAENRMREDDESNHAAVVGAVAGVVIVVLIVVIVIIFLALKGRSANREQSSGPVHSGGNPAEDDGESPTTLLTRSLVGEHNDDPLDNIKIIKGKTSKDSGMKSYQDCPDLLGQSALDEDRLSYGEMSTSHHKPVGTFNLRQEHETTLTRQQKKGCGPRTEHVFSSPLSDTPPYRDDDGDPSSPDPLANMPKTQRLHSSADFDDELDGGSCHDQLSSSERSSSAISDILKRDVYRDQGRLKSPTDIFYREAEKLRPISETRPHYVRTPKTTQVTQDRESFL